MIPSNQIKKWIFIGGAPRSGTSLLQAIFNQHSECTSPPEAHIKETFVYAATTTVDGIFRNRTGLEKRLTEDRWIPRLNISASEIVQQLTTEGKALDLFRLYMEMYAQRDRKSILVEGAPFNIWFMKKLYIDFPGCYILQIVRDPRDVVVSTIKANYNKGIDFPLENIASQFMESYFQGPKFGDTFYGDHYIKIYYEDLITRPEETIRYICQRLSINYEPGMLHFQESSKKVAAREEDWKANLAKPFISDNFNKWMTEMSREDIIKTEFLCRDFFRMESEHYHHSKEWQSTPFVLKQAILFPIYIKFFKRNMRKLIVRENTSSLDKLPPHERLRKKRMLLVD